MVERIHLNADGAVGFGGFATTHWSLVLRAAGNDPDAAQAALGHLYETYWYPLYVYLRRRGQDAQNSQDLVQEIFLALLSKSQLASVGPDRGRFRSYLMSSANHLIANAWRKENAQKRGSGPDLVRLDAFDPEERYALEPVDRLTPDLLFERRWALAMLESVLAKLRADYATRGQSHLFDGLRVFLSVEDDPPTCAKAALNLGLTEGATRVAIHRLRQKYRDWLRAEIAATIDDPGAIEDELRHLLVVLRQ